MEIVGIDRPAYELERLYTFVSFRHSEIGGHRRGGVGFVDCNWRRVFCPCVVGRHSSAPGEKCRPAADFRSSVCRGVFAPLRLFLGSLRLWPSAFPRSSAKGKGAIVGGIRGLVKGLGQVPLWETALSTRLSSTTWPHISTRMRASNGGDRHQLVEESARGHLRDVGVSLSRQWRRHSLGHSRLHLERRK